ncbi:hypothetical protein FRX31_025385 [Thalictrum thalictroides]|uniref:Endonuclease/exonuclease/phosphatase domain-containing protein n=1 Tax=Thalictrum thalictroides TaxID=46969 RepID=A0A7J6VJE4_THATH|nr:hypothetical protein FRX31_025385 [Thalictrum thalictroides]
MACKLVTWNVRGLANDETCGAVRNLIKDVKPVIIILQETKISDQFDPSLSLLWRHPWRFEHIPSIGLSGGLLVAWNSDFIEVVDSLKGAFSLSLICKEIDTDFEWLLSGIYGPSKSGNRTQFFQELVDIRAWSQLPCCLGVI